MAVVDISRFEILLISLDPSHGAEIQKTRPCIVISPNEMNKCIKTIIIAPMTSKVTNYPSRVYVRFNGKEGTIVLDQIRTIDKSRIVKKLGILNTEISTQVIDVLNRMFSL